MKSSYPLVLAAIILSVAMARGADQPTTKPHALPADAQAPVIILDTNGVGPDRVNQDPVFQLASDGTAIVGNPFGNERAVKGKISPDQLHDLLRYVLDEMKFGDITAADLASKSKSKDRSTVTISVDANGTEHQLTARAVTARRPKAGSPLDRFRAVEKRLTEVRAMVVLGGDDGVRKFLIAGNAQLKIRFPKEPPMQASDLEDALALPDGNDRATFSRKAKQADGMTYRTTVSVTDDGKGHFKSEAVQAPDPW